jgi:RNA polymerase sigma-70 factor (ECF subfamily)
MSIDIASWYERYGPMVLQRCRTLLRNEDEAQDAAQDVFLNLLKAGERLNGQYPTGLLCTMATNCCLNRLRQRRRQRAFAEGEEAELPFADRSEEAVDARLLAETLLREESETDRTICRLYYADDKSLKEMGAAVQLSISGVRKRLLAFIRRAKVKMGVIAATVLVLVLPVAGIIGFADRADVPANRLKGAVEAEMAPELDIYIEENGTAEALKDGAALREGDTVQLAYRLPAASTGEARYGVIFSIDGRGAVTLHYPYRPEGDTRMTVGRRCYLRDAYTLDDAPEFEDFYLVTRDSPLDAAAVLEKVKGLGGRAVSSAFPGCDIREVGVRKVF